MIPIWFVIGINILVYGITILIVGIVNWSHPAPNVAMTQLHADAWWGALMTVIGLIYTLKFKPAGRSNSAG
jgi:hypothetical protein